MNISLKSFSRPLIRQIISLIEPVAGFWTDPTGWLPNRFKMLVGSYEKFLIRSICKALPENGVFVDVGANVGFISQHIARRFQNVRVFAFEPNPRIYPILQKNLKAFPHCESFHVGLGANEGHLEFFHGEESCVGSFVPGYTSQHPGNYLRGHIAKSKVQVTTGDTVLSHIGTIDVMKMDVEGYEIEVLRGMSKLLAEGAIKTIFFEFCPFAQRWAHNQPEEIIHLLIKSGYAVYEVEGESEGSLVCAENITALIARLGDRGYTTLRANPQSGSE
jgi:FkbM family methyltransferase